MGEESAKVDHLKGREAAIRKRSFGGPPRPPSAFTHWARDQKKDLADATELAALQAQWDKLSDSAKAKYVAREAKEMKEWNLQRMKDDEEAMHAFDDDPEPPKKKRNRTAIKEKV